MVKGLGTDLKTKRDKRKKEIVKEKENKQKRNIKSLDDLDNIIPVVEKKTTKTKSSNNFEKEYNKTNKELTDINTKQKIRCLSCDNIFGFTELISVHGKDSRYNTLPSYPFCNKCLNDVIYKSKPNYKLGFLKICSMLDIPMIPELIDEILVVSNTAKSIYITIYLEKLIRKYNNIKDTIPTFIDGEVGTIKQLKNSININVGDFEPTDEIIIRWGSNREPEQYMILENNYKQYQKEYNTDNPNMDTIVRNICIYSLELDELRNNNVTMTKEEIDLEKFKRESLINFMKQLDAMKKSMPVKEKHSLGETIALLEAKHPIDIIADIEAYTGIEGYDYDKYLLEDVYRPLLNHITGDRELDKLKKLVKADE